MTLRMKQDTNGDFLRYQEWLGMIFDTMRLHKIWFQEVDFNENLKILTESWRCLTFSALIQNLGWIQLESTLKIISAKSRMFHLDTIWVLKSGFPRVRPQLLEDALISETCPVERMLRTIRGSSSKYGRDPFSPSCKWSNCIQMKNSQFNLWFLNVDFNCIHSRL